MVHTIFKFRKIPTTKTYIRILSKHPKEPLFQALWKVVDIDQEQQWSNNRALWNTT